ncbi:MAG: carboxypeptidase-like regulatory domain-containing protein [Acidobacteriota bacterium]|nr:carboxypeptidase-like regulatory domain-containing protein [Acidobacteriota bacterium]
MKNVITIGNNSFSKFKLSGTSSLNIGEIKASNRLVSKTKRAAFVVNTVFLMLFCFSLRTIEANAAAFTVNLTTDANDANTGDGICDTNTAVAGQQCTLRAAIQQANATVGVDDITFSLGGASTINLTIGELSIVGSLNITGPGARLLTVQRAAGVANFRIFFVQYANAATVNISGITVANGNKTNGSGGGIDNNGATLNLTGVAVRNNTTSGSGGGIMNAGTLNLIRSTVSNNTALQGGGINNNNAAAVANIINSTISDNTADDGGTAALALGGGIVNYATMTVVNSTISNNTSIEHGGGIYLTGTHSTSIRNTIIAANTASYRPDVYGTVNSQGNNLIGISYPDNGFTNGVNGDKTGIEAAPLNAQLGALQDNGGSTDTRALLPVSPALNSGSSCVADTPGCLPSSLATDQRGTPRKAGSFVDIGAYEEQLLPTAASVSIGGRVLQPNGRGLSKATVVLTNAGGEVFYAVTNVFGHYRFDGVSVGETYLFEVQSKRYVFPQQALFVTEERNGFDFVSIAATSTGEKTAY